MASIMTDKSTTTPAEKAILDDYTNSIYHTFQPLYEDKWDENLWQKAIGERAVGLSVARRVNEI